MSLPNRYWVRARLSKWGRFARGGGARGYPSVSAFYRPCVPSGGEGRPSEDIEEIDRIVCIALSEDRHLLIVHYSTTGTIKDKARSMGITRRQYGVRRDRAENFVAFSLDSTPIAAM